MQNSIEKACWADRIKKTDAFQSTWRWHVIDYDEKRVTLFEMDDL